MDDEAHGHVHTDTPRHRDNREEKTLVLLSPANSIICPRTPASYFLHAPQRGRWRRRTAAPRFRCSPARARVTNARRRLGGRRRRSDKWPKETAAMRAHTSECLQKVCSESITCQTAVSTLLLWVENGGGTKRHSKRSRK